MKTEFKISSLIRPSVAAIAPYRSARDIFKTVDKGLVFLDANENPFNTTVNRYPDPHQQILKERIAAQKGVALENILLGNGSDEILDLIFRVFCEPGTDNVITLPPTYGMYNVLASLNGIENRKVLLSSQFEPDVSSILSTQDDNSKLLFLCSPNNPTGNQFSETNVIQLLNRFNGLVVMDEAYIDFAATTGFAGKLAQYPNLIVVQTFSKAYGMAGIRLGMAMASEEIIKALTSIKPPYNINELTQQFAYNRLLDSQTVISDISKLLSEKKKMILKLSSIQFIDHIFSSDANFILVRVDDASKRYRQLLDRGIVVRDQSNQPMCDNCLRITVGTPIENEKLIKSLNSITV
jgi:histidinol-phosphate aminotransferase